MNQIEVRLARMPEELTLVHRIRYLVFQLEQGVDPTTEFDGKDANAEHLLASISGKPVGTARIRFLTPQTAKLERLAVLSEVRGLGIGRKIVENIVDFLSEKNVQVLLVHAQQQVQDYYLRFGFEPEGQVFEEAGIPHVKMKKLLC